MLVNVKKKVPEAAQKPTPDIFGKNCPFSPMYWQSLKYTATCELLNRTCQAKKKEKNHPHGK